MMNAPLWVTGVRIVAIPPLMALLLIDDIPGGRWWAFGVFILASLSDSLDGWLARSRGLVTVVAAWAAMIIIAREFAVTGLRLVAAAENVIMSAGKFGKAKAFSQNVALALIICPGVNQDVRDAFLYLALVLTVLSGAHYFLVARWRLFTGKAMSHPDAISEP